MPQDLKKNMEMMSEQMGDTGETKKMRKKQTKIQETKKKKKKVAWWSFHHGSGVPIVAQQLTNLTSIHEDAGSIPDLTQ